jgi:3'(2'), 5'-bisphosphate nucleotidase
VITSTSRPLDSFDHETRVAVHAVADAMRLARSLEGRAHPSTKSDQSPVTVADLAIQAVVAERLAGVRPGVPLIGEECAGSFATGPELTGPVVEAVRRVIPDAIAERVAGWIGNGGPAPGSQFWVLDPIDGTKGFIHGRQYVIALACIVDGRVEMSVIGCPRLSLSEGAPGARSAHGGMAIAVRGQGAWWSATGEDTCRRLAVSTCADVTAARVVQSFEAGHGDPDRCARVLRRLGNERSPRLLDSQAKHVTVAAGSSDLLLRLSPHPGFHDAVWDQAAGSLLIEEAGGRVTDLAGQSLDFSTGRRLLRNTGMVGSNGLLHAAVLEALHIAR